jgi:hypothetical protein
MADELKDVPHREIDVDFPLEIKRSQWGDAGYVYCPPEGYNFFTVCSRSHEGLQKESEESFTVKAYEKGNDGMTHVGLPYSFALKKLYNKNVVKQIVEYGGMLAVIVYFNSKTPIPTAPPASEEKPDAPSISDAKLDVKV